MSDGSKMGLFGSKDRNQEQKEKSSKDNSPARYAPYGVDSDTETYDTEALSMMDINDIIGVQSGEQIGDSTLESEIAALSQIITESKVDTTLQLEDDPKPVVSQDPANTPLHSTSSTVCNVSIDSSNISDTDKSNIVSDECTDIVCEMEEVSDFTCEAKTSPETSSLVKESVSENVKKNYNIIKCDEASNINTNRVTDDMSMKETVHDKQGKDVTSSVEETVAEKVDGKVINYCQNETNNSTILPLTVGNISKSLQLIGEAYDSEDSEETDVNDNDSPKETSSLFVPKESLLSNILTKQDNSSETTVILEQKAENSLMLRDPETVTTKESDVKVEKDFVDTRIENLNQSKILQQTLEIQESIIDDTTVNKMAECVDSDMQSCKEESGSKSKNFDIEMGTVEKTTLKHESSTFETCKETTEFINTSTTLIMEVKKDTGKDEESIEIESNISPLVSEIENQDNSLTVSEKEILDTEKMIDNCPTVEDVKELEKNVFECKEKDAVSVSAHNKTQESTLIETSNKEISTIEIINKNDDLQQDVINTRSQVTEETQEIVLTADKIDKNNDFQETVSIEKNLEKTAVISDNQENANIVTTEEISVPTDKSILEITSNIINKELILKEDASVKICDSSIEEKDEMANVLSAGSHVSDVEGSDQCSKRLIQSDTILNNFSDFVEVNVHARQDALDQTLEKTPPIDCEDKSLKKLSSASEKEENNATSSELKELHSDTILHENLNLNTIENITKPEAQETENVEEKIIPKATSSIKDNVTENISDIAQKEDEDEKNIASKVPLNETAIREPDLDEKKVKETEKSEEEKDCEMSLNLDSIISQTNLENVSLQDDRETEPCEKIMEVPMDSKESIDDVTSVEENNVALVDSNIKEIQSNIIDISLLQESSNEKINNEKLAEKFSENSENLDAGPSTVSVSAQSVDTLEGLLDITLMSDSENSSLKDMKTEDKVLMEEIVSKNIDMDLLLNQTDQNDATMTQNSDYITNVIASCFSNRDNEASESDINSSSNDKSTENENNSSKMDQDTSVSIEPLSGATDKEKLEEESLEADTNLRRSDLDMDFESNRMGSVDLEESETKLELSQDILLESVMPSESLSRHADTPTVIENSQSSSEISELESAVKFLQESEEQTIDSLVLSPKMVESVVEDITKQANTELYVPDEIDNYANTESELPDLRDDSISISEAEIISEAAKLENERKIAAQMQNVPDIVVKDTEEINMEASAEDRACFKTSSDAASLAHNFPNMQTTEQSHEEKGTLPGIGPLSNEGILKTCELIPRVSILEERLKEPPKIEIPVPDSAKILESSISPTESLLIPKDARAVTYSRMLESADVSRKDSEKHSDLENVGSPRIILKIAKSAITDCSEPRSPKSPKIRSATNSPNPEDSPGQKLGKIKLKLSKGGHPSIISNENLDEVNQWHTTENTSSLSPIGMKIKLSKSGDASIIGTEKHESLDDSKETKYKIEEPKRTDSPIGMKFKLSKSGDASIISDSRQDIKEAHTKHKDKLEMPQGSPMRTESPIGMKFKLSKTGDASIIQTDRQESFNSEEHKDITQKRTDSPIGMKFKLSKTGDASIVSPDTSEDSSTRKEKQDHAEIPKRTESPIGMKIKLSKCKGGASIISVDNAEDARDKLEVPDPPKRTESPLGMKIKLSKTGDASIIHSEVTEDIKETKYKDKSEISQDTMKNRTTPEASSMKIKMKTGETSLTGLTEEQDVFQASESSTGIPKIKVSKSGDVSVISNKMESTEDSRLREGQAAMVEAPKRTESPLGMKIKLSKSGDASIVQNEAVTDEQSKITPRAADAEYSKGSDSPLGMKIKLFKTGDASVVESPSSSGSPSSEKRDKQQRRRDAIESPLEMKIKLSKTGHPTIVTCDSHGETSAHKAKEPPALDPMVNFSHRYMEHGTTQGEDPALKMLKAGTRHSSIVQSDRSELTIEPVQLQSRKQPAENSRQQIEISPKRKDITISPVESKKSKLEAQLSQILPEVTIQPVMCQDQKQQQQQQQQQQQLLFDPKTSLISRQQMNVINQEISITQVRPMPDNASDKFKDMCKNSPGGLSDCEIIEHRPELIIVNENSNSSQDVVIIEEVMTPQSRTADIKVPKKRGRPRRNPLAAQQRHVQPTQQPPAQIPIPRDPLALDELQVPPPQFEHRENERPKRTCRSQKSYAPPKRGRGRGRGKRKLDNAEPQIGKKGRIDQDLSAIEASTTAIITIDETTPMQQESLQKSSELYKALKQPPADRKSMSALSRIGKKEFKASNSEIAMLDPATLSCVHEDATKASTSQISKADNKKPTLEIVSEKIQKSAIKQSQAENKSKIADGIKEIPVPPDHSNWLTPTSKKQADSTAIRSETVSTVQVIDEETRMSAESSSRSQTPARNIPAPTSETIINEESQGSVLSTATTESEKVKVKNRRMEINFDPDEGPFTVDKIAEYEWPLDRKGETFMIQEQISQYLGVKSFKRKYPDLKRRVVDMEERNYLRENGLVSESMCDMGLTAICSSEVLDVMCSDFPDQYEEYRKHMREKQVKEHSKKQKELTAAANAERNRIDLAEMAMQSAFTWNANLNKARKEQRKYCLDLQTFTIHQPQKQQKTDSEHKVGHYPVALIPGQYTDYYREYTPAELRYYPLNTVLYGPTRPNERKSDSQSEGSQSDSDSESSSDDSSSSSSEGTQDTEGSQSTMDEVDMEISNSKDDTKLKCKMCLKVLNKHNKNEILIQCGTCNGNVHPSCIDLTLDMVPHIQSYAWQCTDCKTCAQCHDPADEDKMLFCDMCDRGYHIYCVGLRRVPQGRWHCQECAVCANCGSREPGGANSDRNSVAQWQHEYKKGEKNTRVYVSTLCVPCSKLWRKGRYCPHCSRCHTAQRLDLEANLVHCGACDKYLHLECVETKGVAVDKKNYLCDFCTPSTSQHTKTLMLKGFKT
ncbi:hypothetical protein PUN28_018745 [Cardiocondyla obscurior]|uniref:PHD-type domain-containing protein n=1 Tax=Cardiocondyla obscurior TaxID=286306 RepID=A0AAW2EFJ3_9HYME